MAAVPGARPGNCNKLSDGTYSWEQPASRGIAGWEGRCGQTAAANLLTIRGTKWVSPQQVIDSAWDGTPGSKPATLLRAVRKLGPNRGTPDFKLTYDKSLSGVSPSKPIVILLQWDSVQLHWVTLVSATSTKVRFNHWGRSQEMPRKEFDERWDFTKTTWTGTVVHWLGWVWPNTAIRPR